MLVMASPWTAQKRLLLYNSQMDLVFYLFYESDAVLHVAVLPGQVRNGVYHVPNEWYPSITGVCLEQREDVEFVNEVQPKDINDLLCMQRPHSFAYFSRLIFCPLSLTIYGTIDERKDVDHDTWETWQPLHLSETLVDNARSQPHAILS